MKSIAAIILATLVALPAAAAAPQDDAGPSLRLLMGEQAYTAAGLDKLSDAERAALYQWLRTGAGAGADQAAAARDAAASSADTGTAQPRDNFGFPPPQVDKLDGEDRLYAAIVPPFRGWDGKTVFKLDNGQVWKQRRSGRFTYLGEDTRVVIYKGALGFYEMRLIAADRAIGVKRLQ